MASPKNPPRPLSLGKRSISVLGDNNYEDIPALCDRWVRSKRIFAVYKDFPTPREDGSYHFGACEEWVERTNLLIYDFKWLLRLEHHRFWSQVYFMSKSLSGVVSLFLAVTPRYALHKYQHDNKDMSKLLEEALRLAFLIVVRLATEKESETEYLSIKEHGDMLYDSFLITTPVLLAFSAIYGAKNGSNVSRIINTVFTAQPNYFVDLEDLVKFFKDKLRDLDDAICTRRTGDVQSIANNYDDVQDYIIYLVDATNNVSAFIEAFVPAGAIFHKLKFESSVVSFYESAVPKLTWLLQQRNKRLQNSLTPLLKQVRLQLILIFRQCLDSIINRLLDPHEEQLSGEEKKRLVEEFCNTLSKAAEKRVFMRDYQTYHPVQQNIDLLSQHCPESLDSAKMACIIQGVLSCCDECIKVALPQPPSRLLQNSGQRKSESMNGLVPDSVGKKGKIDGVQLNLLISEVKEILPHLGEGFILKCLEHFNYSVATVLNAILEGSLPAQLLAIDVEMPIIPPEPGVLEASSGLAVRRNVFDNDEFDIMTRDQVNTSRIHRGKRGGKHKNLVEMLDDKEHCEELTERYSQLGLVPETCDIYDDEYDDTYDGMETNIKASGEADRRPFVLLRRPPDRATREENEATGSEERGTEGSELRRDLIAADERRIHYEESRQFLSRAGGGWRSDKFRDVVGKPKGLGQEKNVVLNRGYKETHKGSHGNHNRRAKAQQKRACGMFPS